MRICPNCGWSNDAQFRFCENCGADLDKVQPKDGWRPPPASEWPDPPQRSLTQPGSSQDEQYSSAYGSFQMAPLPPQEVPERKRRVWIWVVMALFVFTILVCVGAGYWLTSTDSGQSFQTEVATQATEQAEE